jgi:hypothetical protein
MRTIATVIVAILIISLAIPSFADVVIKRKLVFGGVMGMGGSETMETEYLKSDRSCTEKSSKSSGGLLGAAMKAADKSDIQITRLDKELIWDISSKKKTYTETPFASFKELMAKGEESVSEKDEPISEDDDDEYEWTVEIKGPDNAGKLNGFECKNISAKATGINKEDPKDTIFVSYEYWLGQNVTGVDEMNQYYRDYAKALGVDEHWTQQGLNQSARAYGTQFGDLFKKVEEAGGFPIKIVMTVKKAGGMKSDDEESDEESAAAMAKLGGLFGKKKAEESSDGRTEILSTSVEILGIESKAVDGGKFEVPAGYKKK